MRVAIVGSRSWPYDQLIKSEVNGLPPESIIVSGGAVGVDRTAELYGKLRDLKTIVYKPDWDTFGRSAGYRRNVTIIGDADRVIAFQHNKSKGTQHSIDLAVKKGIPVKLYRLDGEDLEIIQL